MEQKHDFRQYDDAKAMAGDPVGCRVAGYKAEILMRDGARIIGASTSGWPDAQWIAVEWTRDGYLRSEPLTHPRDLVMIPLCYIQDKPAYPGDTLYDANGEAFQLDAATAAQTEAAKEWTWEKPSLAVETNMGSQELIRIYATCPTNRAGDSLRGVANAAIARAIADDQVVLPEAAADRQNRASDVAMDMGMYGAIKGNRAAIDHLRMMLNLPEKVAHHVQSEAAMLMLSRLIAPEEISIHREDAAKFIRQMDIQGIIRKAKGE